MTHCTKVFTSSQIRAAILTGSMQFQEGNKRMTPSWCPVFPLHMFIARDNPTQHLQGSWVPLRSIKTRDWAKEKFVHVEAAGKITQGHNLSVLPAAEGTNSLRELNERDLSLATATAEERGLGGLPHSCVFSHSEGRDKTTSPTGRPQGNRPP